MSATPVGGRLRRLAGRLGRRLASLDPDRPGTGADVDGHDATSVNDRYVEDAPSVANAVSLFAGDWSTRLPIDAPTGTIELFGDRRVVEFVGALGGVEGQRVLELGPLEGAHTATLRRELGAAHVTAIEANTGAFLRCLVTKEVLGLDGVEFRLGDVRPYLADTDDRFDLAVAIGVLYHLDDPVPVLADLARVTDRIVIWTHVHAGDELPEGLAERFDPPVTGTFGAATYRLHPYRYETSLDWSGFCGGTRPTAAWIERDDFFSIVDALGFEVVRLEELEHPYGPALTVALRRR